jgi:hypothetical protein
VRDGADAPPRHRGLELLSGRPMAGCRLSEVGAPG